MSLVTIIAKSSGVISWEKVNKAIVQYQPHGIEFFPIPRELGFSEDAIGIAVPKGYRSREKIILTLVTLAEQLNSFGLMLVELYSGKVIDPDSIVITLKSILPPSLEE